MVGGGGHLSLVVNGFTAVNVCLAVNPIHGQSVLINSFVSVLCQSVVREFMV